MDGYNTTGYDTRMKFGWHRACVGVLLSFQSLAYARASYEAYESAGEPSAQAIVFGLGSFAFLLRKSEYSKETRIYAAGFARLLNWMFWLAIFVIVVAKVANGFDTAGWRMLSVWGFGQFGLWAFTWGCNSAEQKVGQAHYKPSPVGASSQVLQPPAVKPEPAARAFRRVAWRPKGMLAPPELVAVMLPPGRVTEAQWWDALADRVRAMATTAGPEATYTACRTLGMDVAWTSEPGEAGQCLVEGNWNLRTHLTLAMGDNQFPVAVEESDPDALLAIEDSDLQLWAELAAAQVSASSLE
jgi:hypothetical protein